MCTKIQKEFELSQRYELEKTGSEDGLVALTEDNVAKVEAMIRTDSNYRMSPEDQEKSPYWILALGKHLRGENCEHKIEDVIKNVVEKIDNENSVHLNADNVGRQVMIERIIRCKDDGILFNYLRNRNLKLIDILSEKTKDEKRGRRNISFASKFCHYACFYIFRDEDAQDNFSIYDRVIAEMLPKYLDCYCQLSDLRKDIGRIIKNKDYRGYSDAIDAIIEASRQKISRNGFDHLVWYYNKGKNGTKRGRR